MFVDVMRTDGIKKRYLSAYPFKPYETFQMIDREVKEGVHEMCQRSGEYDVGVAFQALTLLSSY